VETFSVWNYGTRQYDYYQGGEHKGTHITQPNSHLLATSRIGLTPDEFAQRVPEHARKVGSGAEARGQVASFGERGRMGKLLLVGVLAFLAWRYLR
jgi:hypothetical protein